MKAFAAYLVFTAAAFGMVSYTLQGVAAGIEQQAADRAAAIEQILR